MVTNGYSVQVCDGVTMFVAYFMEVTRRLGIFRIIMQENSIESWHNIHRISEIVIIKSKRSYFTLTYNVDADFLFKYLFLK